MNGKASRAAASAAARKNRRTGSGEGGNRSAAEQRVNTRKTPAQKNASPPARLARKRLREVGMNRGFMRKREEDEGLEGVV